MTNSVDEFFFLFDTSGYILTFIDFHLHLGLERILPSLAWYTYRGIASELWAVALTLKRAPLTHSLTHSLSPTRRLLPSCRRSSYCCCSSRSASSLFLFSVRFSLDSSGDDEERAIFMQNARVRTDHLFENAHLLASLLDRHTDCRRRWRPLRRKSVFCALFLVAFLVCSSCSVLCSSSARFSTFSPLTEAPFS